jgi:IQ calmodulin-binding motif
MREHIILSDECKWNPLFPSSVDDLTTTIEEGVIVQSQTLANSSYAVHAQPDQDWLAKSTIVNPQSPLLTRSLVLIQKDTSASQDLENIPSIEKSASKELSGFANHPIDKQRVRNKGALFPRLGGRWNASNRNCSASFNSEYYASGSLMPIGKFQAKRMNRGRKLGMPFNAKPGSSYKSTPHSAEIVPRPKNIVADAKDQAKLCGNDFSSQPTIGLERSLPHLKEVITLIDVNDFDIGSDASFSPPNFNHPGFDFDASFPDCSTLSPIPSPIRDVIPIQVTNSSDISSAGRLLISDVDDASLHNSITDEFICEIITSRSSAEFEMKMYSGESVNNENCWLGSFSNSSNHYKSSPTSKKRLSMKARNLTTDGRKENVTVYDVNHTLPSNHEASQAKFKKLHQPRIRPLKRRSADKPLHNVITNQDANTTLSRDTGAVSMVVRYSDLNKSNLTAAKTQAQPSHMVVMFPEPIVGAEPHISCSNSGKIDEMTKNKRNVSRIDSAFSSKLVTNLNDSENQHTPIVEGGKATLDINQRIGKSGCYRQAKTTEADVNCADLSIKSQGSEAHVNATLLPKPITQINNLRSQFTSSSKANKFKEERKQRMRSSSRDTLTNLAAEGKSHAYEKNESQSRESQITSGLISEPIHQMKNLKSKYTTVDKGNKVKEERQQRADESYREHFTGIIEDIQIHADVIDRNKGNSSNVQPPQETKEYLRTRGNFKRKILSNSVRRTSTNILLQRHTKELKFRCKIDENSGVLCSSVIPPARYGYQTHLPSQVVKIGMDKIRQSLPTLSGSSINPKSTTHPSISRPQKVSDPLDEAIMDPIDRAVYRLASKAAIPIQAGGRRLLARKHYQRRLHSLIYLQSYFRRWRCEVYKFANQWAAIKVQSALRGWKPRCQFHMKKQACIKIQKHIRGYLAKVIVFDRLYKVIHIQAFWRGEMARWRSDQRRHSVCLIQSIFRRFFVELTLWKKFESATLIQSTYRRHLAQMNYQNDVISIVIVQTLVRRSIAMKEAFKAWNAKQNIAATQIQKTWKSFMARRGFKYLLNQSIAIQRMIRGFSCRRKIQHERLERHATTIQSQWRCYATNAVFYRDRLDIVTVQSVIRMHFSLQKVRIHRQMVTQAAIVIQSCWRRWHWEYERKRSASAATIQLTWRLWRQILLKRYIRAARLIQKCWRSHCDYIYFKLLDHGATGIQSLFRGYCVRQEANLQMGCAIIIQSAVRMWLGGRRARYQKLLFLLVTSHAHCRHENRNAIHIQRFWRKSWSMKKQQRAANSIIAFFLMVKYAVDQEVMRQKKGKSRNKVKGRESVGYGRCQKKRYDSKSVTHLQLEP